MPPDDGVPSPAAAWDLQARVPASPAWNRWVETTHVAPPAFDLLQLRDPVDTSQETLRADLARWIYGSAPAGPGTPPTPAGRPGDDNSRRHLVLQMPEGVVPSNPIELEFDRAVTAPFRPRRIPPGSPGILLLCGPTDLSLREAAQRGWFAGRMRFTTTAVSEDTEAERPLPLHPAIATEAWRVRTVIDFLLNHEPGTPVRVVLAGQGFGGKVALWAAAQDRRVAAVLAVDSGPGGACPFRFWTEAEFGPGVEITTRAHPDWFTPPLRFFAGREDRLPVDAASLLACLAPRPVLVATALNNPEESAWAVEQAWRAAQPRFVREGVSDALGLDIRAGRGGTTTLDWSRWLDWTESRLVPDVPDTGKISGPLFPTREEWLAAGGKPLNPEDFPPRGPADLLVADHGGMIATPGAWRSQANALRVVVGKVLGPARETREPEESPPPATPAVHPAGPPAPWLVKEPLIIRPDLVGSVIHRTHIVGTTRRLPALVWLHPWSVPTGYEAAAFRREQPSRALTRSGSVVLTFDLIGCGTRVREGCDFTQRHPGASLLSHMVQDTRDAVSALARHPHVDPAQIFLLGGGLGGVVALHAAALDDRVAGVLDVAGFPPMRGETAGIPDPRLAGLADQPPLLPQLADFDGRETQLPYDFTDLLALIAPRPTLVVVPRVNRFATVDEVTAAVEAARPVYALMGNADALVLQVNDDYNHFTPDQIWCLCNDEAQR